MLRWKVLDGILLAGVVAAALAVRIVWIRKDRQDLPPVQWPDARVGVFAKNLVDAGALRGPVALQPPDKSPPSASLAPGYPLLLAALYRSVDFATAGGQVQQQRDESVLHLAQAVQCVLGAIAAGLVFLIARRLFESYTVAVVAGLLAAGHYFWVAATAEQADGVLASLLLSFSVWAGLRMVARADVPTTIACSLGLGCLALTRGGLLLFAGAAVVWIACKLRGQPGAWRYGLLSAATLVVTLLPWTWRNAKRYGRFVPVTTETGLSFWWGNNDEATGGLVPRPIPGEPPVLDTTDGLAELINPLTDRGKRLSERSEPERFASLRREAYGWVHDNPRRFVELRFHAAVFFLTGQRMWLEEPQPQQAFAPFALPGSDVPAPPPPTLPLPQVGKGEGAGPPIQGLVTPPADAEAPPDAQEEASAAPKLPPPDAEAPPDAQEEASAAPKLPPPDNCAPWVLSLLLVGGLAGMRWSWRWRPRLGLLTLTLIFGALPSIVTHAGLLHGPRLPLDGILLVYTAFALTCLIPGLGSRLRHGPADGAG